MIADRAALQPERAEAQCLERHSRNPDGREEMTFQAPHHNILAAHPVAALPGNESRHDEEYDGPQRHNGYYPRHQDRDGHVLPCKRLLPKPKRGAPSGWGRPNPAAFFTQDRSPRRPSVGDYRIGGSDKETEAQGPPPSTLLSHGTAHRGR